MSERTFCRLDADKTGGADYLTEKMNKIELKDVHHHINRVVSADELIEGQYEDFVPLMTIFNHDVVETVYQTESNELGKTWRWRPNTLMVWLYSHGPYYMPSAASAAADGEIPYCGNVATKRATVDLNVLWMDFYKGAFDLESLMKFHMSTGYSLCGFSEIYGQKKASSFGLDGETPGRGGLRGESLIDYILRKHAGTILKL